MEVHEHVGSLTDRTVRRGESEQRAGPSEDDVRYTKTFKRVGRSLHNVRSMSSLSSCSLPVLLSCVFLTTILTLDMNQYILGRFHCCTMNIFNLQFLYNTNRDPGNASDAFFEPFVRFSNGTSQRMMESRLFGEDQTSFDGLTEEALANQLALIGVPNFDRKKSDRSRKDGEADRHRESVLVEPDAEAEEWKRSMESFDGGNRDPGVFAEEVKEQHQQKVDETSKPSVLTREVQSHDEPQVKKPKTGDLQKDKEAVQEGREVRSDPEAVGQAEKSGHSPLPRGSNAPPVHTSECDIFYGRWVYDPTYPLYSPRSCPYVDEGFSCTDNGRPDTEYLKWRWHPYDCDLPRFNGTDMLERLRDKRMTYIGDSLGRNQWESMLCLLYEAAPNKSASRVYEVNGQIISKLQSYLAIHYADFNATVEFIRAPFLVHQGHRPADAPPFVRNTLHVDRLDTSARKWNRGQILVFNSGHWWTYAKTLRGRCYFAKGGKVVNMEILEAFEEGMRTWAQFIDRSISSKTTRVFFRSFSPTHFRGGQWNTGGQCSVEVSPYTNRTRSDIYHPPTEKVRIAEGVISRMKTPVTLLNTTELTDYRRDGHPSKWTQTMGTYKGGANGSRYQDCSHWCLPGVPDTWNELLYSSLVLHPDPHYDLSSRSNGSIRTPKKRVIRPVGYSPPARIKSKQAS